MKTEIDELRLQRLVDGVLGDQERAAFLTLLDKQPELWREVALAFVEEQIWSDTMAVAEEKPRDDAGSAELCVRSRNSWKEVRYFAMAISLLLMFGVGMRFGHRHGAVVVLPPASVESEHQQVVQATTNATTNQPNTEDALADPYSVELEYDDGQSIRSVVVPVLHTAEMDSDTWHDDVYQNEFSVLNRQLESKGYQLEWQTEYLGGQLSGNRNLVVPVRAISLRHRGL